MSATVEISKPARRQAGKASAGAEPADGQGGNLGRNAHSHDAVIQNTHALPSAKTIRLVGVDEHLLGGAVVTYQ